MAAVGTASNAPTMPSSYPPINSDTITVTALTPTCLRHDCGHEHMVFELLLHREENRDEDDLVERHRGRHGERGNRRQDRSDHRNQFANAGEQCEHIEERNPDRPQPDGGRRADDRAEQELPAEPGTHLQRHSWPRLSTRRRDSLETAGATYHAGPPLPRAGRTSGSGS